MRVAHIITRMIIGGAQENTLLTCKLLARDYGDDVLLLTGPSLEPEGDLISEGRTGGIPRETITSLRREIHPARDWQSYRKIKAVLREFEPDIVHTHSAKGGVLGRMAATAANVPAIVHTVHGAPFHAYQGRLANSFGRRAERFAAGKCHRLISVADAMTDQLVEARIAPREKFTTVYSGMEVEPFLRANEHHHQTRSELGFDDQHVVVGKIARLFHLKGHQYVIDAARTVVKHHQHVRFLFVGDGILSEQLEEQVRQAELSDYFQFVGLVTPERIPALIGAMDVLVHASLREGLARALPQALIAGKPVVSFDIDGASEVVISNQTGCLVQPRDVAGLAESIMQLADDRELRTRMGQAGQNRFTEQFRAETMVRQIRQIYESLLEFR
jgi:glycosyltransferase involved in cell wall biosynthesis